ncbi:RHS repeat-associated core domain-containing protein [Paenibacillus sp. NPDC056579]|uniref:RHS repeat-associated core domain-containing protein n=1 Tax=Paenibacillus sp. NPDC056579 TaxID=3345871 RepID=UPI00367CC10F
MTGKDGKKTYFAEDGRVLGIVDRYDNTIKFEYLQLTYKVNGKEVSKKLLSKITDTVGRVTTIEYKEDHEFKVGPIGTETYGASDSYKSTQNPNNQDSGDLNGKFQVIVHLPDSKQIVYDKSAVLVNDAKQVLRTRLQRVFDIDGKPKYHYWYEQPDLGFTFTNGTGYSVFNRYEYLVQVDYTKTNQIKRYGYSTYTKRLNTGSMQYRKIFEAKQLVKTGFDPAPKAFMDKFITDVKDKTNYTYTNEADGFGTEDYKENSEEYLRNTYRYYTEVADLRGNSSKYTYDGLQQLVVTEKVGSDHKEVITNEMDEMKLVKKQQSLTYKVVNGQPTGEPVKKIENYRYDEYGNLTNYTGPEAVRNESGYPVDTEHTVVYSYAYDKYHVVSMKTWKQDKDTTGQSIFSIDDKGNVIKETKVIPGNGSGNIVTDYQYDSYGNMTRKEIVSGKQSFVTQYEYGTDASGTDVHGAYLTKEYSMLDGVEIAKTYAYDFNTGIRLTETDANGNKTSYEYDALNRVVKTTQPDNYTKQYSYEENPYANLKIQYTDPAGVAFTYEYDIQGNLLQSRVMDRGQGIVLQTFEYDSKGSKIKETDSNGHSIRYEYDSKNRVVNKSFWENGTADKGRVNVDYAQGDQGTPLLVTITDEEGYVQKFHYDILDRLTKAETTPDNAQFYVTTFAYDYVGNKIAETDPKNQTTQFTYDSAGRLIVKKDALGNETQIAYNSLNQVTYQKEPGGKITEIDYDVLGRTAFQKIYKQGVEKEYTYTSYHYDPAGNILNTKRGMVVDGVDSLASDISYVYDAMNRAIERSARIDDSRASIESNSYNPNGNKIQTIQYASADKSQFRIYTYAYDYSGQVKEESGAYKVQDGSGNESVYGSYNKITERDYAGNVVKEQVFNGTGWDTTAYSYNYKNKLTEKVEPYVRDQTEKRTKYQYDKKGNLLAETINVQGADATTSYHVDGLGRIIAKIDPLGGVSRYAYDANGNKWKEIDPRYSTEDLKQAPGKEFEYDALNRLIKTVVFDGSNRETIEYREYDARGNVRKLVDGEGYNSSQPEFSIGSLFEYDMNDKKITYISAQTAVLNAENGTHDLSSWYTYDGAGNLLSEVDAIGSMTRNTYYLNGLIKEKTFPDGSTETYDYDLTGKALQIMKDRSGNINKTFLSVFDKPYRIEYPDGTSESFTYSPKGEVAESYDQAGQTKAFVYDPSGNLIQKKEYIRSDASFAYSKITKMQYDEANRVLSSETLMQKAPLAGGTPEETSAGDKTDYIYDKVGRLTKVSGPNGKETIQTYDRAGLVTAKLQKVEDGNYDVIRYEYDIRSQLVKQSLLVRTAELSIEHLASAQYDNEYADRVRATINSTYTKNGKLKSTQDAYGHVTSYEYDYDSRLVKKTDPIQAVTAYRYDLKGNLVEEINSKGSSIQYAYDALNRLIKKQSPAADGEMATARYVYDAAGNLVKQIAPNDYDPAKDTASLLDTMIGMMYVYDMLNRRTATIAPNGQGLEYIEYNSLGQVRKTVNGVQYNGEMSSSKGTMYEYDGLGRVLQSTDPLGHSTAYTYDVLGNATSKTDARNNTTSYVYNPDNTLDSVIMVDGGKLSYTYDKLGRKTSETDPLGNTTSYVYNAFGKERTVTDAYGYTIESKYDLNGNPVIMKDKRGSSTLLKYDAVNRLVQKKTPLELDGSGNVVYAVETFGYDSLGNVLKKSLASSVNKDFYRETVYTYYDNNLVNTETDNSGGYTKKHYDKNGNVIKLEKLRDTDAYDIEKFVYDSQNRLIQRIRLADAASFDENSGYASAIELKDEEYPDKIRLITGYAYDAAGNKVKEIDPRAYAFPRSDTANRDAYTTVYTYDAANRLDKVIRMLNSVEIYKQFGYDEVGNKIVERNERGFETRYTYDHANRIKTVTDAEQHTLTYEYDLAGNKIAETNAKGFSMRYQYDKLNRLTITIDPYNTVIQLQLYDENGNVVKKVDAKGYQSANSDDERYGMVYEYDLANRLVKQTDPEQSIRKYQYNVAGQKVKETNGLDQSTLYAYDAAGRLVKVTDPLGVEVTYGYDNAGNKLHMTDGRGKVTQYSYNALGWMKEATNAASLSIHYQYDLAGNVAGMIDRIGNHTVYTYDSRNLLLNKQVKETGDSLSYTYDEVGNRSSMVDNSGTSSYAYDKKNQLLSISQDGKSQISYTYDALGNVESITDLKGNQTTYTYDKSSRMETVAFQGNTTTYTYDENGNRKTITYEGGVNEEYTFDKNNRVVTLTNKKPDGDVISSYSYTYDAAGQQDSKTDSFGTTRYIYDAAGRIAKVEAPGKTSFYVYDHAGNRQTLNETYTSLQPSGYKEPNSQVEVQYKVKKSEYVYSNTNELLKLVEVMYDETGKELLEKTISYLYDENGNQIRQMVGYIHPHTRDMRQVTGGNLYGDHVPDDLNLLIEKVNSTFDGFNQLKQMEKVKGGERVTVDYTYDGDGLRTKKVVRSSKEGYVEKVTNYLYDRQHVILETDASGNAAIRYVRGVNYIARVDSANKHSYYLYNGHGDVVQTVSAAGDVENQYDYDIFGSPTLIIEQYGNAIRYAGEYLDEETGLYYLRARYYDPHLGRFISQDSYWGDDTSPLSLNLYTYGHNNPIKYIDPSGHSVYGVIADPNMDNEGLADPVEWDGTKSEDSSSGPGLKGFIEPRMYRPSGNGKESYIRKETERLIELAEAAVYGEIGNRFLKGTDDEQDSSGMTSTHPMSVKELQEELEGKRVKIASFEITSGFSGEYTNDYKPLIPNTFDEYMINVAIYEARYNGDKFKENYEKMNKARKAAFQGYLNENDFQYLYNLATLHHYIEKENTIDNAENARNELQRIFKEGYRIIFEEGLKLAIQFEEGAFRGGLRLPVRVKPGADSTVNTKNASTEGTGKGASKFDPLSNPKIAKEIEANPDAVYGYSPKKGSSLDKFGVDWTDSQQVASARTKRMEYLQNMEQKKVKLESEVAKLQSEGISIEDIARMKVEQRNSDRIQSYIDSNNYEGLAAMKERNIQQYGRPEGPTPKQLFEKYGSWDEVIYSSVRTSPAMDVLTGLYKQ